jgi:hypothetical protein
MRGSCDFSEAEVLEPEEDEIDVDEDFDYGTKIHCTNEGCQFECYIFYWDNKDDALAHHMESCPFALQSSRLRRAEVDDDDEAPPPKRAHDDGEDTKPPPQGSSSSFSSSTASGNVAASQELVQDPSIPPGQAGSAVSVALAPSSTPPVGLQPRGRRPLSTGVAVPTITAGGGGGEDAPAAGVAVADDHDDSNLIPISVNDVLYTASVYVAVYDKYDHSTIHGKRVKDNIRYHFGLLIINEEGFRDQNMTILVTKSEETFLRTQVYPYWRKEIDRLHAQRTTTSRATNMAIATGPHPPPGSVANGGGRNRNVSIKEVIVLLILIAYVII